MKQSPNDKTRLVAFLQQHASGHSSFPSGDVDYYCRFRKLDDHLNQNVHPTVNQGATAKGDGWLTDHGSQHVTTVIHRAGELVANRDNHESVILTPYETFLLITAIHFHDVGNVFGRDGHERHIADIMAQLDDNTIGSDAVEKRMIRDIAMAHGGYVDGNGQDKDTIGHLSWEQPRGNTEPRMQFLAAVLRFADELADDHTRTNRFLVANRLLRRSEAYHMYADRLRRVDVQLENQKVRLHFELDVSHATKKYLKGRRKVYLYDEIVERGLKMYRENLYCGRFMQPYVWLDTVEVCIIITTQKYMKVLEQIMFSLSQRGYPDWPTSLSEADPRATRITGKALAQKMRARCAGNGQ